MNITETKEATTGIKMNMENQIVLVVDDSTERWHHLRLNKKGSKRTPRRSSCENGMNRDALIYDASRKK